MGVARNKPVMVVKAVLVPEGAKAAASYIGTLAGADDVCDAAMCRHAPPQHHRSSVRCRRNAGRCMLRQPAHVQLAIVVRSDPRKGASAGS